MPISCQMGFQYQTNQNSDSDQWVGKLSGMDWPKADRRLWSGNLQEADLRCWLPADSYRLRSGEVARHPFRGAKLETAIIYRGIRPGTP